MRKKTWKAMDKLKPWFLSNYHLLSWFFDLSCVPLVGDCRSAGLELQKRNCAKMHRCNLLRTWRIQRCSNYLIHWDNNGWKKATIWTQLCEQNLSKYCRGKDGKKCRIKQWWCLLPSKQGEANTKPLLCFGTWSERTMRTTRSKYRNDMEWQAITNNNN